MKTNVKLDKRKNTTKPPHKRIKSRKPKSNPLPIILISLSAIILFILVIILSTRKAPAEKRVIVTNDISDIIPNGGGSQFTAEKKEKNKPAAKETVIPLKKTKEEITPKNSENNTGSKNEAEEENSATEPEKSKVTPAPSLPPREQSIANLKKIGEQYKHFAANHQGHMPIELFQLDLLDHEKVSPLTNKPYFVEQEGKGSFLKDSLEYIIVREAAPVDGKYICLLGNGEVREFDAETVEQ